MFLSASFILVGGFGFLISNKYHILLSYLCIGVICLILLVLVHREEEK